MPGLVLARVGFPPRHMIHRLSTFLAETLSISCTVSDASIDPRFALDSRRGQYDCRQLLPILDALAESTGLRVLGVADVDLFSPVFEYVFGEARLGGNAGLFSLHRLNPILYGLPENRELLEGRARREALHETGHLFGLTHCRMPECVMRFSGSAEEIDLKSEEFCRSCRASLAASIG